MLHTTRNMHLSRLCSAMNVLMYQGQSEGKLLETYNVVPSKRDKVAFETDDECVKILNIVQSVMNTVYIPIGTIGDGNCLYRAVSSVVTGSEDNHVLLRLITALELINNRSFYDTKKPHNDFINDCRIVTSEYDKLVHDAIKKNTYSEMAHIYALSAALCEPIQSYFPPQIKPELSAVFTRTVVGRDVPQDLAPQVMLMWSSMKAPVTLTTYRANHFVPLINKETIHDNIKTSENKVQETNSEAEIKQTEEQLINTDTSANFDSYPLFDVDCNTSASFGRGYGCETLDEPVTLSDISVRDLVTGSPEASNPSPTKESDSVSASQAMESDMHGVLVSGFLDTSNIIAHLLKDVPGIAKIPSGSKENVYFILDNKVNSDKKSNKKKKRICR
ncbi:uncharacterized protein LOC128554245 [Mercenaria mercenaria]|uniref:uncharacterized protein LOC128554245 n=1 Tax=Mercenaria mercenaria TaxID=6596 RepID=UPI00234EC8A0|nr:uncharacterized protein LOC128554245 [Mercenaria mercenaria]